MSLIKFITSIFIYHDSNTGALCFVNNVSLAYFSDRATAATD